MGAEPYWYFTKYDTDTDRALQHLRDREFQAGRYNPVMPFIPFGETALPAPGAEHDSIDEAREAADADGTRSILDIECVADEPDFCVAAPLDEDDLVALFGTAQPTHEMVESNMELFDLIDRGQARYIVVYRAGRPDELFFAGYSFD